MPRQRKLKMGKVILVTTAFAISFICGTNAGDNENYHLPPGSPPSTYVVRDGKLFHAPPRHKFLERYVATEIELFGGGPPRRPLPPPRRFRLPHPNSIPRGYKEQEPFDIVRAPVIYHQTVTDTDVTRAISDAFDVVEKLRKPGKNKGTSGVLTTMPIPSPPTVNKNNVVTSVEFVNHIAPGTMGTTTTTIVEAPHQVEVAQQPLLPQHQSVALVNSAYVASHVQDQLPPVPVAHDLPPQGHVTISSSIPVVKDVPATPIQSTLVTSLQQQPTSAKLIIPSQSHVTTLSETVQAPSHGDGQVRTIIQPVYIPYAVDQNGQPVGPLPDYHSMDFGAILSAQNQFVVQDVPRPQQSQTQQHVQIQPQSQPQQPQQLIQIQPQSQQQQPQQLVEIQPQSQQQQPQQLVQIQSQQQQPQTQQLIQVEPQPQQYYVQQQDQATAGDSTSDNGSQPSPSLPKRGRIIRRRKKANRRDPARRN